MPLLPNESVFIPQISLQTELWLVVSRQADAQSFPKKIMTTYTSYKTKALEDPEVQAVYNALQDEYDLAQSEIEAQTAVLNAAFRQSVQTSSNLHQENPPIPSCPKSSLPR